MRFTKMDVMGYGSHKRQVIYSPGSEPAQEIILVPDDQLHTMPLLEYVRCGHHGYGILQNLSGRNRNRVLPRMDRLIGFSLFLIKGPVCGLEIACTDQLSIPIRINVNQVHHPVCVIKVVGSNLRLTFAQGFD